MGELYRCPHCGKVDSQITDYSRRELRQSMGSRTSRRQNTKSALTNSRGEKVTKTNPSTRLADLMREARREHEQNCSEREE